MEKIMGIDQGCDDKSAMTVRCSKCGAVCDYVTELQSKRFAEHPANAHMTKAELFAAGLGVERTECPVCDR
jgi:hypothetical protein